MDQAFNSSTDVKYFAYIYPKLSSNGLTKAELERLIILHQSMINRTVTNLGTETLHNKCIIYTFKQKQYVNISISRISLFYF